MVDVKIAVVFLFAAFSIFLQPGIRAQPTIDSHSEEDSCSQLEEVLEFQLVENKRLQSLLESVRMTKKTLAEENHRLKLENERHPLRKQTVTATFVGSFNYSQSHYGITKVEDKIYVLVIDPNSIKVYEDLIDFRFMTVIALGDTDYPYDIVYSNNSKRVYITDFYEKCIWVMTTTREHRMTKWLNNVTWPFTLSLSNEGHLLVLRHSQSFSQDSLEIYSLNATLIRSLQLPQDVKHPLHVVQTSTGNFIISHRLNSSSGPYVISQLMNDGQLIHRFIPKNQSQKLSEPYHLSLDSDKNRLFVADYLNNRVILFDSSVLTWSQVLLSKDTKGINYPFRLFYDASKKHLFVAQYLANVTVYEID